MQFEPRQLLLHMFEAAVAAAQAKHCIGRYLPRPPRGRTVVIGAGKASAAMAQALESLWRGDLGGLVVTRYGHAVACRHVEVIEAAHPVSDAAGERAARRLLESVSGLSEDDLVVALISGGGSSLLPMPVAGVTLAQLQAIQRALLDSGASVAEINCVRRHLSGIAGGRLAAACVPAQVVNLLISDVPGDHPYDIASGPTVADPTSCADALDAVRRYHIALPAAARRWLESGEGETVKPNDPRLARVRTHLIATPNMALEAAAAVARDAGVLPCILGDRIEGEAREVGKVLAGVALQVRGHAQPVKPPCVLLSGGEATVTIRGTGRGGPNVECLLSMAIALAGCADTFALAADTDGVDGQEEIAGAIITPDTIARARAVDMAPCAYLDNNDGHGFFQRLGDAVVTGPTLTNVNDFRAILVL